MKLHLFGVATAALIGCASAAYAADPLIALPDGDKIIGSVGFTTQYFSRGLRQTDEGTPAVQAGVEYDHSSGIYLGVWGSNVSEEVIGPGAGIEIDFSAGYRGSAFDPKFTYDVGVIYYYYPGYEGDLTADWVDGKISGAYDFGVAQAALTLLATPDFQYESGAGFYLAGDVTVPIGKSFSLFLHGGYQWIDDEVRYGYADFFDYSIGIGTNLIGLDLKLAYLGTTLDKDEVPLNSGAEREAVVFTISKSF